AIELPAHMLMNIQVLEDGKLMAESRDLEALKTDLNELSKRQMQGMVKHELQRENVQRWDFGDLPEATQSEINGLQVRAFPCLKVDNEQLQLTVEADADAARRSHRRGLVTLFRQSLSEQERLLKNRIQKNMNNRWLQAKGMGTQQSLTNELVEAAFQQVFVPLDEPLPYKESDFQQRLLRRATLVEHGEQLLAQFI
ncbi:DUF3418 domain-containing protein, partial [Wenyingzhuangia sp. 1_MG-2023]|nr:DUF3418 domain-containing protein [Wenyingzhuangia sp. 1_MG-2023]